ncbi:EAL domain-containing protein [Enterobacter kobei]
MKADNRAESISPTLKRNTIDRISNFRLEPFIDIAENRIIGFEVLSSLKAGVAPESWFSEQRPVDLIRILKFQLESISALGLKEPCFFNLTIAGILALSDDDIMFISRYRKTGIEISDAHNIKFLSEDERAFFFNHIDYLRESGVCVWVDDFYFDELIHLNYYRQHVDGVKMDRSEVRTPWLRKEISLIRNVLGNVDILVEGVETDSDLTAVRKAGARLAQGYFWNMDNLSVDVAG